MKGGMDSAGETLVFDAATALLDCCRAQIAKSSEGQPPQTADYRQMQAISVAVQSVIMAELATMPSSDIEGFVEVDRPMAAVLFKGLGVGVGQCVGSCGDSAMISLASLSVLEGMSGSMEMRGAETMRDIILARLNRKPKS